MEMSKIEKRFEVLNKVENKEADMYLYGSIGSGWYADISSKEVRDQLNNLDVSTINIHLNSGGGDVFESIAIHNLLKSHKAKIVIHIDGLAASGASVIAMAGDKVIMPKNAMMMIHNAWTFGAGNAKELRKIADDLEKIDTAVLESYTSKFVGEREELKQLLADETWLTAEEAKALGLADEIIDDIQEENEDKVENSIKENILNKYQQNKIVAEVKKDNELHNENDEQIEQVNKGKFANAMYQFLNGFNTAK
ncbi:head maturation protease, ClpP-related [Schinkia azotoformans]|uniref:head maturation protease, ClpP-related n=1 Tax=Schinkia azotoformans TaxID=1454 RepID=UPI002DB8F2F4|nr:head maturation protease, ClpP-related [Schinkia azotoformans]MEC1778408.1 Clp protease ClpP [Schinkia azotoformans]MED4328347.1 Clp protease ClpP [Schinkia azotoformans]